ncbi:GNAT family N-acetyltransferase [Mesobacillus maritimus]|uniref:GNAT family N-acetyltransferase n=1 Tax=Mesobacillus maritimus TaxID=1643336 RepID=A0ABS7K7U5_9BACI|nr:GNAT family N-acetyltransferase [Mesobacillus maritimus]MBY0098165.1 GNAT family N-acetyltransferase [Mesobacillus maritimus]
MKIIKEYPTLETERTILRILTKEDAKEVFMHFSDPIVTRFMDIEPCKDLKEAEEIIHYHEEDLGCRWGIVERSHGIFIGTIGFHYLRHNDEELIGEIGFDLSKSHWGKGYMTEVIKEIISFGFTTMGLDTIDASVETNNQKSIKILETFGFKRDVELRDQLSYYSLQRWDYQPK